jgi:hypothetical protein
MGRLILVAGIAIIVCGGTVQAKPDHAGQRKDKSATVPSGPPGFGVGGCPPGLRSKNPQCLPPGQYKKLFEIGQRVPSGYGGLRSYGALPRELRMRHGGALDPNARYIYDQNYIYRVDPTTMVVRQILRSLL